MAYAVGLISGGHFNPAVSLGLWAGGKFDGKSLPGYVIAQFLVLHVLFQMVMEIYHQMDIVWFLCC